jgi:hypothetical protein
MDETGVMLSMLGSVKVLVGKDDRRNYRGAGVKRTMVTAVECVSADGKALLPLIIWPASTHCSNWTTHKTPGWHYAHSENGYNDSKINLEWRSLTWKRGTVLTLRLASIGNPNGSCAQIPVRRISEVLRQVSLQKQRREPPDSAAKSPSDCLC